MANTINKRKKLLTRIAGELGLTTKGIPYLELYARKGGTCCIIRFPETCRALAVHTRNPRMFFWVSSYPDLIAFFKDLDPACDRSRRLAPMTVEMFARYNREKGLCPQCGSKTVFALAINSKGQISLENATHARICHLVRHTAVPLLMDAATEGEALAFLKGRATGFLGCERCNALPF